MSNGTDSIESQLLTPSTAAPHEVIQQQATTQDYLVLRLAVIGLIIAILLGLVGVIYLTTLEREVPEGLIAIGSAAVGALATMLVSPRR